MACDPKKVLTDLEVSGSINADDDITNGGDTSSLNITARATLTANGDIEALSDVNVSGALTSTGNVDAQSDVNVSGTLTSTGNIEAQSDVDVTGEINSTGKINGMNDLQVTGTVLTYSELWVSGGGKTLNTSNDIVNTIVYDFMYKSIPYYNRFILVDGAFTTATIRIGSYNNADPTRGDIIETRNF